MKNILVVVNPISGGENKDEIVHQLKTELDDRSISYQLYETSGENDEVKIASLVKSQKPDTVIAIGGDGTVNLTAKALINKPVSLGIIPIGSANGLAKEFGIPADPVKALNIVLNNNQIKLDTIKVNDENFCFHLGDIGLNAKIIERFEKEEGRGMWGYLKNFLAEIIDRETHEFLIKTNENELRVKAQMIAFANARQYGTGAVLNSLGKPTDSLFELIVIKPFGTTEIIKASKALFDGTFHELDFVDVLRVKEARISNSEKQQLQVDGELIGKVPFVDLKMIPGALNFIVEPHYSSN